MCNDDDGLTAGWRVIWASRRVDVHSNFSHLFSLVSVPLRSLLPSRRHGPTFLWKEMSILLVLITESNIYFVFLPG